MKGSPPKAGIAFAGAGVVGGGVLKILRERREDIVARAGVVLEPVAIAVREPEQARKRLHPDDAKLVVPDWQAALAHPQAEIAVELVGGGGVAREFILAALSGKKPVVTANKALLAENGGEIFAAARRGKVPVAYEAAVAGCIPVVKALREALAGDEILEARGVINGTCNYILTKMEAENIGFAEALAEAGRRGYAEADPSLDIDGWDAAHKIALIARLAFGATPSFSRIPVTGARGMDLRDIQYARDLGCRVKLLAVAKRMEGGGGRKGRTEIRVHPGLVPREHLLARVEGAMNAVVIRARHSGETMYSGAGAGAEPTAVAVVADLADIARRNGALDSGREIPDADSELTPLSEADAPHYMRARVIDRPGALADCARILADRRISIEAVRQNESAPQQEVDIVLLTHTARHGAVLDSAAAIEKLDSVVRPVVVMMMEGREGGGK